MPAFETVRQGVDGLVHALTRAVDFMPNFFGALGGFWIEVHVFSWVFCSAQSLLSDMVAMVFSGTRLSTDMAFLAFERRTTPVMATISPIRARESQVAVVI